MSQPSEQPELLVDSLRRRLRGHLDSWPRLFRSALAEYLQVSKKKGAGDSPESPTLVEQDPFWLRLPLLLAEKYSSLPIQGGISIPWLPDVLWGQWCLFLSFRLQDDLFDQNMDNQALVPVSNLLRLHSEATFQKHLEADVRFWDLFRNCQRASYEAAAEIDRLQTNREGAGEEMLTLYAQASSIFMVGAMAVCLKFGEPDDIEPVKRLYNHLAIAGQIVDDLMDVEEDLDRNRHNFAVNKLVRSTPGTSRSSGPVREAMLQGLILGSGSEALIEEIQKQLSGARKAIEELDLPTGESLVKDLSSALEQLQRELHHLRVRVVLGPLVKKKP